MIEQPAVDALLAAAFRGEGAAWPAGWSSAADIGFVQDRIIYHGIAFALCQHLDTCVGWPTAVIGSIREEARMQAFWEESHRQAIAALIGHLAAQGVQSVLLKGTALAYSLYQQPAMRRRGDSDLLVHRRDLVAARKILRTCGFARIESYLWQEAWQYDTGMGFTHVVDLHWHITNSPMLERVFDVEETFRNATPLPQLAPAARRPGTVTLFLQCCINQALHEHHGYYVEDAKLPGGNRLIWALDNHLLAQSLDDAQWRDLADRSLAGGIAAITLAALHLAMRHLGTAVPPDILARLTSAANGTQTGDLSAGPASLADIRANLRAVHGPRDTLVYLWMIAFPPAEQIRLKYRDAPGWPMPLLYLRRLLSAGLRMLGIRRGGQAN